MDSVSRCFLVLLPLVACTHDQEIVPGYPTTPDAICRVDTTSAVQPTAGQDRYLGRSVAMLSSGSRPGSLDERRWAAAGASGDELDEEWGEVRVTPIDLGTGQLTPSDPDSHSLLPPPLTRSPYQFGWSLLAVDARGCRTGRRPDIHIGCGQELLISAPDTFTHTMGGAVWWYEPSGEDSGQYVPGGSVTKPMGLPGHAEFGYALAAPTMVLDPELPWRASGQTPLWVAVSAPGADQVFLYAVDPSSSSPFTWVQTLGAPRLGRRFGQSLAAGDFDGDGWWDLAVGMPQGSGSDPEGRVLVYRGQGTGAPLRSTPLELNGYELNHSSGGVEQDRFGWSLAAGEFVGDHAGDALLVGAPRAGNDDDGGYCQFVLLGAAGPSGLKVDLAQRVCELNPFYSATHALKTEEHLGYAVAVGNFYNADQAGDPNSPEARLPEIALGRPGFQGDIGAVNIFLTDERGVDPLSTADVLTEYVGPSPGARFGQSLAGGYAQETHWQDLVIGAPLHVFGSGHDGSASLTQATETASCVALDGTWMATDDSGNGVPVQIASTGGHSPEVHILVQDWFQLALYEDYGTADQRLCTQTTGSTTQDAVYFLPPGLELVLPGVYHCSGSGQTWSGVDASALVEAMTTFAFPITMDVTVTPLGAASLELDLSVASTWMTSGLGLAGVDEPSLCRPQPLPMTLARVSDGVCE